MTPNLKRKLTIGVIVGALACLAGGGAYAATQASTSKTTSSDPQQAFLNDVAGRLHVSVADLQAAFKGAAADQIDAAAKAGKLTQAQADAIKKKIQAGAGVPFIGPFLGRAKPFAGPLVRPFAGPRGLEIPFGPGAMPGIFQAGLDAATKYLGLTRAQLKQQVGSGKSLADIAKAQNKTVDGLTGAIKDAVKAQLDKAVAAKKLTQAQETRLLGFADQAIPRIVNGVRPGVQFKRGLFFRRGFHPGP